MLPPATVSIRYPVRPSPAAWLIPEGIVPEAPVHDEVAEKLKLLLKAWAARSPGRVRIARNLAVRFYAEDERVGIDPDLCVLAPPPPELDEVGSVCLWKPGHTAPTLCIEIVSLNHPNKDYLAIQDRYAALGTHELVVFDPLLAGPRSLGGPVALQLWRRSASSFDRLCFGDDPVYSEVLDAWFVPDGRSVFIADDRAGKRPWLNDAGEARLEAANAKEKAELAEEKAGLAEEKAGLAEERAELAEEKAERAEAEVKRARAEEERARFYAQALKAQADRAAELERELADLRAALAKK